MKKTELVIFKHQRKKLDSPIKIKLSRKRLYPSKSVKYLGIKIDENLNWKQHIHDIAIKLNRANALLSIIRNYVNKLTLRTIYFAIFDSHINYANLIWGQNLHSLSRIIILQKKALRIMNFQSRDSHSSPLFRSNHILKLEDKILIENIFFLSISLLITFFLQSLKVGSLSALIFTIITVSSTADKIFKPSYRTDSYGKNSITLGAINSWNKTQHQFSDLSIKTFSPTKIKSLLFKKCIGKYYYCYKHVTLASLLKYFHFVSYFL